MGYYRDPDSLPEKGCGHVYSMTYLEDRCWCDACGTTWRWAGSEPGKGGWKPMSRKQASRGEIRYG